MTMPIGTIKPEWQGKTVYILGGGPSVAGLDLDLISGKPVIGINDGGLKMRTPVLFSMDKTWITKRMTYFNHFNGDMYFAVSTDIQGLKSINNVNIMNRDRRSGMHKDPGTVNGLNSGYGALNLAYHIKPSNVVLLGFDMGYDDKKKTHWHDGYEWGGGGSLDRYKKWASCFDMAKWDLDKMGIRVYNASKASKITCFEYIDLSEAVNGLSQCL